MFICRFESCTHSHVQFNIGNICEASTIGVYCALSDLVKFQGGVPVVKGDLPWNIDSTCRALIQGAASRAQKVVVIIWAEHTWWGLAPSFNRLRDQIVNHLRVAAGVHAAVFTEPPPVFPASLGPDRYHWSSSMRRIPLCRFGL